MSTNKINSDWLERFPEPSADGDTVKLTHQEMAELVKRLPPVTPRTRDLLESSSESADETR